MTEEATVEDKVIVERLRKGSTFFETNWVMQKAAALIERLTSERDEARAKIATLEKTLRDVKAMSLPGPDARDLDEIVEVIDRALLGEKTE